MNELEHYGTPRKSGRYPWGSGEDPQHGPGFLSYVDDLRRKGLSEQEIAQGLGISTTLLRAKKSIARMEKEKADIAQALRLKDKGLSNVAIGKQMDIPESSVRNLIASAQKEKKAAIMATADILKEAVKERTLIDIGAGVETQMGISGTKLSTAAALLKEEGYGVHYLRVEQLGTGNQTSMKVLAPPGMTYSEVYKRRDEITPPGAYSETGGKTYLGIEPPRAVSSKRLTVKYGSEGGADKDGVIELRRGVADISMGKARYVQARIAVDGTHYLKGMCMYADDLPPGVDIRFNTNKESTGNHLDALKKLKDDPDNPFGSVVRQTHYLDSDGKSKLSSINIVYEEGDWGRWSKTLSPQVLSKQSLPLAKRQLAKAYAERQAEYDSIMKLTNPAVRKKMLAAFADDADAAAVHLKAAAMPRQKTHVILPVPSLKETEIYAPNYKNGENVVLVRFPHGGIFEIPSLIVNNKHKESQSLLGQAVDAVGIHPKVAARLSGADFDGDTVLVIPNNDKSVKVGGVLKGLKDFDPKIAYPEYEGMKVLSPAGKQKKMGDVSNLITDMTIKGANVHEIARAVRHSMVIIDAEKHRLNWKQSYLDNGIAGLKEKYQGSSRSGASTLISRSSSDIWIDERKPRSAAKGGPIDAETGKKVFEVLPDAKKVRSKKMAEAEDAYSLSSGTPMESIYAAHANALKTLANTARKSYLKKDVIPYDPSAAKVYRSDVISLGAKYSTALKNKPLERRAQVIANSVLQQKKQANPDLTKEEIKKIKFQALAEARNRVGAARSAVHISDSEWKAVMAGALTPSRVSAILEVADLDRVKELATPRPANGMDVNRVARAKAMLRAGRTQAEVAEALGVSTTTINNMEGE